MGSPRKNGNTHVLLKTILEGVHEKGGETEMILLGDLEIKECDGCHTCWKGSECMKKDDMLPLYLKLMNCDTIIFGTPVYWYGPTGLMKLLIDRLVFFNCPQNRAKIRGKDAVLVIPFEEEDIQTAELTVELFKRSLMYLEIPLIETILSPGVTKRGEVSKNKELMRKCYRLVKDLIY